MQSLLKFLKIQAHKLRYKAEFYIIKTLAITLQIYRAKNKSQTFNI